MLHVRTLVHALLTDTSTFHLNRFTYDKKYVYIESLVKVIRPLTIHLHYTRQSQGKQEFYRKKKVYFEMCIINKYAPTYIKN